MIAKNILDLNIDYSCTNISLNEIKSNDAVVIEKCWKNNTELHRWMEELNSYDQIADLTVEMDATYRKMTSPFVKISKFYYLYAKLKIEQNDFQAAANTILALYSIVQKTYPYSRTVLQQLILTSVESRILEIINTFITKEKNS
ncbi:hypothetical protein KAH27_05035 [bacterium]|nr:hypothetical protein [bacterium]